MGPVIFTGESCKDLLTENIQFSGKVKKFLLILQQIFMAFLLYADTVLVGVNKANAVPVIWYIFCNRTNNSQMMPSVPWVRLGHSFRRKAVNAHSSSDKLLYVGGIKGFDFMPVVDKTKRGMSWLQSSRETGFLIVILQTHLHTVTASWTSLYRWTFSPGLFSCLSRLDPCTPLASFHPETSFSTKKFSVSSTLFSFQTHWTRASDLHHS